MENLLGKLREKEKVNPSIRALANRLLALANSLLAIAWITGNAGEAQIMIQKCEEGISILDKRFGVDASKYDYYGGLLSALGAGYEALGMHFHAEYCYVRALQSREKVADVDEDRKQTLIEEARNVLREKGFCSY